MRGGSSFCGKSGKRERLARPIFGFLDFLLICADVVLYGYVLMYYMDSFERTVPFWALSGSVALFALAMAALCGLYGVFDYKCSRRGEIFYSNLIANIFAWTGAYFMLWGLGREGGAPNPAGVAVGAGGGIILGAVWSYLIEWLSEILLPPQKAILVFETEEDIEAGKRLIKRYPARLALGGMMSYKGNLEQLECAYQSLGADCLILCGLPSASRNEIIGYCASNGRKVLVKPSPEDFFIHDSNVSIMGNAPVAVCGRRQTTVIHAFCKRAFDIIASALALVLLSPLMLVVAIAIKCCDGGPVFYFHTRLTKDGKQFRIYKFRSMRVDAESDGVARLSTGDSDSRITPIGKVIRKLRLDELPQLLNILKGDMSVVGPRPERPEIAAEYLERMPEFNLRLQVKAGLTGYAQVYGKYNTSPSEKLAMDLIYINHASLLEDLKLILLTVKVLFVSDSTEGIKAGKTNAI